MAAAVRKSAAAAPEIRPAEDSAWEGDGEGRGGGAATSKARGPTSKALDVGIATSLQRAAATAAATCREGPPAMAAVISCCAASKARPGGEIFAVGEGEVEVTPPQDGGTVRAAAAAAAQGSWAKSGSNVAMGACEGSDRNQAVGLSQNGYGYDHTMIL